ncbi:MAG: cobalamin B12-binding domain-containing protein [Desulfobacterales bacterium]|nr:cobalamin B12-binding domain-containing protein [Desulfobacterales bacterium]
MAALAPAGTPASTDKARRDSGVRASFGLLLLLRKRPPSAPVTAQLLLIGMMVTFHILVVLVAPDPRLNLFRYILVTYPPLLALLAMTLQKAGKTVSTFIWVLFCAASATCITAVRHPWQPDATLAGLLEARALRAATASVENPFHPDGRIGSIPALGYVDEPLESGLIRSHQPPLVTADRGNSRNFCQRGTFVTGRETYRWTLGALSVTAQEARTPVRCTPLHPPRPGSTNTVPPIGLLILAAVLEEHGHEVTLIDAALTGITGLPLVRAVRKSEPEALHCNGVFQRCPGPAPGTARTQACAWEGPLPAGRTPRLLAGEPPLSTTWQRWTRSFWEKRKRHFPFSCQTGRAGFPVW